MTALTLDTARRIVEAARAKGRELGLKPLTVAVLDAGGDLLVLEREDGASPLRPAIAIGKANGAVQMGVGSRALWKRAEEQAYFINAMNTLTNGSLVPVPGGVLIRDGGKVVGAVGITGDTSNNDEAAAAAGIQAVGLTADAG
ncbi:heme-binding protein [Aureimonas sp. Leaf324]|uniref:GlcG/HbpS family heme-binding protein n=1 Tax=Aureimonas sp. Leaf324 TaxID=1736336 RepID=UPI0006FE26F1|nr:heme-binding protein [Aureimonas sp. Leaf324]KQQ79054.1 GlcG protein [Aureimonas sp. Leaf324]